MLKLSMTAAAMTVFKQLYWRICFSCFTVVEIACMAGKETLLFYYAEDSTVC